MDAFMRADAFMQAEEEERDEGGVERIIPGPSYGEDCGVIGLANVVPTVCIESDHILEVPQNLSLGSDHILEIPQHLAVESDQIFGFPRYLAIESNQIFGYPQYKASLGVQSRDPTAHPNSVVPNGITGQSVIGTTVLSGQGGWNRDFDPNFPSTSLSESIPTSADDSYEPNTSGEQDYFIEPVIGIDPVLECIVCTIQFPTLSSLTHHAGASGHQTLNCLAQCGNWFSSLEGHVCPEEPIFTERTYGCLGCLMTFDTRHELDSHGRDTRHAIFKCEVEECGKEYHRQDTYSRHRTAHNPFATRHSCPFCEQHSGANGFLRKDHLTQHVRRVHPGEVTGPSGGNRRGF